IPTNPAAHTRARWTDGRRRNSTGTNVNTTGISNGITTVQPCSPISDSRVSLNTTGPSPPSLVTVDRDTNGSHATPTDIEANTSPIRLNRAAVDPGISHINPRPGDHIPHFQRWRGVSAAGHGTG
ncbi:MAG: hypothetical protein ACRDIL_14985, partial [Candidatus Limnocylindrales bacterium]